MLHFVRITEDMPLPPVGTRVLAKYTGAGYVIGHVSGQGQLIDLDKELQVLPQPLSRFSCYAILPEDDADDAIINKMIEISRSLEKAGRLLGTLSNTITGQEGKNVFAFAQKCTRLSYETDPDTCDDVCIQDLPH